MAGTIVVGGATYFTPNLPSEQYKTYRVLAPIKTHWVPASCEAVGCAAFHGGFKLTVDETTDLGQRQAHYVRHDKSRSYTESRNEVGLTVFDFPAGTTCFAAGEHRKQIRPDQFVVDDGDFRGNPRGTPRRVHTSAEFWVEDFAENQDRLATLVQRG